MTTTTSQPGSFMLLLRGGISNRDLSPEELQRQIERYMNWIEQLRRDGHFVAGEPLEETGKVLSGKDGSIITDGPFTESKEIVGGYAIMDAKSRDEATTYRYFVEEQLAAMFFLAALCLVAGVVPGFFIDALAPAVHDLAGGLDLVGPPLDEFGGAFEIIAGRANRGADHQSDVGHKERQR